MGDKTQYTFVGFGVITLFIGLILVFLWLSVGFDKTNYRTFSVYMNEPVNGLNVKSIVKFNGVDVGVIKEISLNKHDPKQVYLLIDIDATTPITTGTIALLESQGLTGLRYLELHNNHNSRAPLIALKGELYPIIPSKPSLFVEINTILTKVTGSFNKMTEAMNSILDKDNAQAIQRSLRNIEGFTSVLSQQSNQLSLIINNVDSIVKNSAIASKKLPNLMTTLMKSGQSITSMSDTVSKSMFKSGIMMEQINSQTLPKANSLMRNLDELTQELNGLTKELKRNPSMLLRGKSQRQLGPGE